MNSLLPITKKKVLYLDQFFFSHAFRGKDSRFTDAKERIERLISLQLLVVPFSSIHEDETHQWKKRENLIEFIKDMARGKEFIPAYDVEFIQIMKSFKNWLAGNSSRYTIELSDAFEEDIYKWDHSIYFDAGQYVSNKELIRSLKKQVVEKFVDLFDGWRKLDTSFEDDLQAEYTAAGKVYIDFFQESLIRFICGDSTFLLDSPIISTVVSQIIELMPGDIPVNERIQKCCEYFQSSHFKETPYHWLKSHMLATLKALVKDGQHNKREKALKQFFGLYFDIKHIAIYSPYVDAIVVDKPMAELVKKPTVALEERHNVRVFCLNTWNEFYKWLDDIENTGMTKAHKDALAIAFPDLKY